MQLPRGAFHLVLVDELQDLTQALWIGDERTPGFNSANHLWLRRCIAPPENRTVVCGVGDPDQAVYLFRGAHPKSILRFRETFDAITLPLTCCFRCPRDVVRIASHLNSRIRSAPGALAGRIFIRTLQRGRDLATGAGHGMPRRRPALHKSSGPRRAQPDR